MTTSTARRRTRSGAGGGVSTTERPAVPTTLTAPDEVVEEEVVELEEVVVEPDLPVEPEDTAKAEYNRLLAAMPPDEPVYVAGTRAPRLKVGAYTLQPGEVVPGAHGWPRREAYERLGRIERR